MLLLQLPTARRFIMRKILISLSVASAAIIPVHSVAAEYVLVSVSRSEAIFVNRSEISKKADKAKTSLLTVFEPYANGIAFMETDVTLHCAANYIDMNNPKVFDGTDKKGFRLEVTKKDGSIKTGTPMALVKELTCDGKAPGALPVSGSRETARRDAVRQIKELSR
jgi:hypothetical protein